MGISIFRNILFYLGAASMVGIFVCLFIVAIVVIKWEFFLLRNRPRLKGWGWPNRYWTVNYLVYNLKGKEDCIEYIKPEHSDFIDVFYAYVKKCNKQFNRVLVVAFILLIVSFPAWLISRR